MVVTSFSRVPLSVLLTKRFESFVGVLSQSLGVDLVVPQLKCVADMKEFCSYHDKHPWRLALSSLSSRSRASAVHSLFLFRKVIPSSEPLVGPYVERMCEPQEPADPAFVSFCRSSVRRLFPIGWDKRYRDACTTSTLPLSACSENGRKSGGCRGLDVTARWDREDFCSYVLESVTPRQRGVSRVKAIETGGKWRVISIPPRVENALRPFHRSLYDYVSHFEWCLRGDAKPSAFYAFGRRDGEVFVSGDYESATDNLNSEVQSAILDEIALRSRTIPPGILAHARSTFGSLLEGGGVSGRQARGQLMGQLLSFPLLCLVNYITFKYSVNRNVPVRINGDDIVFRSTPDEAARWKKGVGASGLVLSEGKTSVDRRFFSLNSTLFDARRTGVSYVGFVRPKVIWGSGEHKAERIGSLKDRFYSLTVGLGRERRSLFRTFFLKENLQTILSCRRSLTRGMGMKVEEGELRASGLWHREIYYLEQCNEPPLPTLSYAGIKSNDIPRGWSRVSPRWYSKSVLRGWQDRLRIETVKLAWTNPVLTDSAAKEKWMSECMSGCSVWSVGRWTTLRCRKLIGMSKSAAWRYFSVRENRSVFGRCVFSRGHGVLRPDPVDGLSHTFEDVVLGVGAPFEESFRAVCPPICLL